MGRGVTCLHIGVSIHASAREATYNRVHSPYLIWGFNPRLREGGDQVHRLADQVIGVSIHASAREATAEPWQAIVPIERFNPRLREGGDVWLIT